MPSTDDLKISGILYGGNWVEWEPRMSAILRIHGFDLHDDTSTLRDCIARQPSEQKSKKELPKFVALIRPFVSPNFFQGVAKDDLVDARRVMRRLKEISFSFRFLDLPAELRSRVYDYVLLGNEKITIDPVRKTMHQQPAITKVSRQLRRESLPAFLRCSTFEFDFTWDENFRPYNGFVAAAVRRWVGNMPRPQWKHLRAISLNLRIPNSLWSNIPGKIEFAHAPNKGLHVQYPPLLERTKKLLLDNHVKYAEENSKVFGILDGTIILAVISNPRLLDHGTLIIAP